MLWLLLMTIFGLSLIAPIAGVLMLMKRRQINQTPLTLTSCTAPGPISLQGRAETYAGMTAPFSGRPCVYCDHKIERYVVSGYGKRRMVDWETVHESQSESPFYLNDAAGKVLVSMREAHIDLEDNWEFENYRMSDGAVVKEFTPQILDGLRKLEIDPHNEHGAPVALRFTETILPPGTDVYVFGECVQDPQQIRDRLGYDPRLSGDNIRAIVASGDAVDQVYVGYGTVDQVRWRLLWQGVLCVILGPVVSLITGGILFGGCISDLAS